MRHLSNCGDGICNCWKYSFEQRLKYLGFPLNDEFFELSCRPQPVVWKTFTVDGTPNNYVVDGRLRVQASQALYISIWGDNKDI